MKVDLVKHCPIFLYFLYIKISLLFQNLQLHLMFFKRIYRLFNKSEVPILKYQIQSLHEITFLSPLKIKVEMLEHVRIKDDK